MNRPYLVSDTPGSGHSEGGKYAIKSLFSLRNRLVDFGFHVTKVKGIWDISGYKGVIEIVFGTSYTCALSVFILGGIFKKEGRGKNEWAPVEAAGQGPYLWVADETDVPHFQKRVDLTLLPEFFQTLRDEYGREDDRGVYEEVVDCLAQLYEDDMTAIRFSQAAEAAASDGEMCDDTAPGNA